LLGLLAANGIDAFEGKEQAGVRARFTPGLISRSRKSGLPGLLILPSFLGLNPQPI
jgi:hypothetical protein